MTNSNGQKLQTIENKLKMCENDLAKSPSQENVATLEALKAEYERVYDYIVRGSIIRSRNMCTNPNIILDEIHSYYSNLYDEKSEIEINVSTCPFLGNRSFIPTLNDDQRDLCEGQLKYSECYDVLSTFENK